MNSPTFYCDYCGRDYKACNNNRQMHENTKKHIRNKKIILGTLNICNKNDNLKGLINIINNFININENKDNKPIEITL